MLDGIKKLVGQRMEFLESAELLYDDIVDIVPDDTLDGPGMNSAFEEKVLTTEDVNAAVAASDPPEGAPAAEDGPEDDLLAVNVGDDPVDDGVPAAQNDSISDDDLGDLMSVSIDLRSNTVDDVLPVPPMNAADAVDDDLLSARIDDDVDDSVDDGADSDDTDGDDHDDIEEESVVEEPAEPLQEAITIDGEGDDGGEGDGEEPKTDDDSNVTDAVSDKMDEIDEEPVPSEGDDDPQKVLNKLDKLNRDIMATKELVKKGFNIS